MSAAWDSSPALSPVPWGERSREAFNCVPGDQQSAPLINSFAAVRAVELLIIGATAREEQHHAPTLGPREPSARRRGSWASAALLIAGAPALSLDCCKRIERVWWGMASKPMRLGRPFCAVAIQIHWACATGEEP